MYITRFFWDIDIFVCSFFYCKRCFCGVCVLEWMDRSLLSVGLTPAPERGVRFYRVYFVAEFIACYRWQEGLTRLCSV